MGGKRTRVFERAGLSEGENEKGGVKGKVFVGFFLKRTWFLYCVISRLERTPNTFSGFFCLGREKGSENVSLKQKKTLHNKPTM